MKTSDQINDIAKAMSLAQASLDVNAESVLLPNLVRKFKSFLTNQNDKNTEMNKFFKFIHLGFSDCWYWCGSLDGNGYGQSAKGRAHRWAWELFYGEIPKGMKVLHKCDIRNCCNPEHLFLGTQYDNIKDMCSKGRQRASQGYFGDESTNHKMNSELVLELRKLYRNGGYSFKKLGKIFGYSTMTVYRAIVGKSWRNV